MGLKEPSTLPFPTPVHEAFLPPAPSEGPSCFPYDPSPLSISLWGPLLLHRAHFPSFVLLFPHLPLPDGLQPLPHSHNITLLWLGCRGGSGRGRPSVLYIMYIFSCCRECSPCIPCAAHSLVCVCVALSCPGVGVMGMCMVREGTHPRVFK